MTMKTSLHNINPSSKKDIMLRGTAAGIYDELDAHLELLGLTCECLGGGKIEHNPQEKTITIFGTSQVFCFYPFLKELQYIT